MEVSGYLQAPADLPIENFPPPCRWIGGLKGPLSYTSNPYFEILGLCRAVLAFMFITLITTARHLSLFWATWVQFMLSHPTTSRFILILYSDLRLGFPRGLFSSGFLSMPFMKFLSPSCVPTYVYSAQFILFHLFPPPNNIWAEKQIIKVESDTRQNHVKGKIIESCSSTKRDQSLSDLMWQIFLRELRYSPASIIPIMLHTHLRWSIMDTVVSRH